MKSNKKSKSLYQIVLNLVLFAISLCFVMPLFLIISTSLTGSETMREYGYLFFPRELDFTAYQHIFRNPTQVIYSYKTTIIVSIATCVLSTFIMALAAYPLSRREFIGRKAITFFILFTMLFGGGLIPSYIINTQFLHLGNSYLIYILPALFGGWYTFIMRTFFKGLPEGIIESARIDGANEWSIFFRFILPLSKPVLATVALFMLLAKWNDWNTSLIYIRDDRLYSLQYLLQRILREAEFIKQMNENMDLGSITVGASKSASIETIRYAMVVVAAGPMLVIFPFFQKYFAKGLTVGSVKG